MAIKTPETPAHADPQTFDVVV
ncbi:MAG: hypothetical protein JWN70_6380, partial [Planctomycetaceae bacterium]|nr:hypothetical protein [Planctomycetaceae bacterium]